MKSTNYILAVLVVFSLSTVQAKNRKHRHKTKNNIDIQTRAVLPGLLSHTELGNIVPQNSPSGVPDSILSVGNNRIVLCVNPAVSIYQKDSLELISTIPLVGTEEIEGLFSTQDFPQLAIFPYIADVWTVYDKYSNRFFITAFNPFITPDKSDIFIAVSKNSHPSTVKDFYVYNYQDEGYFSDYLKHTVDKDAFYLSANAFNYEGTEVSQQIIAFKKEPLLAGEQSGGQIFDVYNQILDTAIAVDSFSNSEPQFLGPVLTTKCSKQGPALFVQARIDNPNDVPVGAPISGDTIRIRWIENILSNPVLKHADVTVTRFSRSSELGPTQKQPLVNCCLPCVLPELAPIIDFARLTFNTGIADATSLWITHTALSDDCQRYIPRWYQLDISRLFSHEEVTLVQEGNVDNGVIEMMIPAINVDKEGNMGIAFAFAGEQNYPSVGYTGRLKDDPKGTVRMPIQVVVDGDLYFRGTRFGDYSGLAVDPEQKQFYLFVENPVAVAPSADAPFGAESASTLAVFEINDTCATTINAPQKEHLLKKGCQITETQETTTPRVSETSSKKERIQPRTSFDGPKKS